MKSKIEEELERSGKILQTTIGDSMEPMLRNRQNIVVIEKADGMVSILPNVTAMLVKLAGALIVLIMLDKTFALIFIIGGTLMIFVTYLFRKITKKLHKTVQETDGKLRSFLQETAGSIVAIRSSGAEKESEKTADIKMAEHKSARMKKISFQIYAILALELL